MIINAKTVFYNAERVIRARLIVMGKIVVLVMQSSMHQIALISQSIVLDRMRAKETLTLIAAAQHRVVCNVAAVQAVKISLLMPDKHCAFNVQVNANSLLHRL